METTQHFVDQNCLGNVLEEVKFEQKEKRPEDIDLRFLTEIRLGDTYNGKAGAANGLDYRAILYGNKIVWEFCKRYMNCRSAGSRVNGNSLYREMYEISQIYLKIQEIGRRKYFREKLPKMSRKELRVANLVEICKNTMTILCEHPQFKEMAHDFGLKLLPIPGTDIEFRVKVTKFYKP
jgi:hypothetical protein